MKTRPEMRARLLHEASALGLVRHGNVVQVIDAGVAGTGTAPVVDNYDDVMLQATRPSARGDGGGSAPVVRLMREERV